MTMSRIEAARKFLASRYPAIDPTVDRVDGTTEWVLRYTGPDGRRWNESINTRQLLGLPTSKMLQKLNQLIKSRTRLDITRAAGPDDTAGAMTYAVSGPDFRREYISNWVIPNEPSDTFRGVDRAMDPYMVSAMDYGVGMFSARPRSTPDPTARIADMSLEEYVAELHSALDPRGAGL